MSQDGVNVHEWLKRRASAYNPGETGLLALDWWNGNRSVLVDTELNGLILGYSLLTKPEEIYRTLLEATASGTPKIVDAFHNNGAPVQELYACGGLPQKNRLLMLPIAENVAVYEQLYQEYSKLHDYFGRGENDVMKRLRSIREEARH